jgi:pimeloyl-ACP methyl ester carboxylesterase
MNLPAPRTIRLVDGRTLEFACYGDPAGVPAVFFHGFVGSHFQASLAHDTARRQGLLLIAPNRPGVGRSTAARRGVLADCAADVAQLADALGLGSFGVIGVSGGAPYALACLARLPGRVALAALVSGLGPLSRPEVLERMSPLVRRGLRLACRLPWLARVFFALRARDFRSDPERFLARLMSRWSRFDQELFRRPEVRSAFLADLREVLVHGAGPAGMVRELQLYFHWGFDLGDVPPGARVVVLHGRHDLLVPPGMAEHFARHLPGAELVYRPGGHFMIVDHVEELIGALVQALVDFQGKGPPTP